MSEDAVARLRRAAELARDLDLEVDRLEGLLADVRARRHRLLADEMPELMDAAGVDRIGVPASGNAPAVDFVLGPFYRAGIAKAWPEDKKRRALDLLKKLGAEDLIKTEVTASLPRGRLADAERLVRIAEAEGIAASLAETVHAQTLTAWLREVYDRRGQALGADQLEALGASVGRVVRVQERIDR